MLLSMRFLDEVTVRWEVVELGGEFDEEDGGEQFKSDGEEMLDALAENDGLVSNLFMLSQTVLSVLP